MTASTEPFEDRLLDALIEEHPILTGPAFATFPPTPKPKRTRRVGFTTLAATSALAGGVAAGVLISGVHHESPSRGSSRGSVPRLQMPAIGAGSAARAEDVADIVDRVRRAVRINDAVVEQTISATGSGGNAGHEQVWTQYGNRATLMVRLDAAGRRVTGSLQSTSAGVLTTVTIDYRDRTYSVTRGAAVAAPAASPLTLVAAALRAAVAHGRARLIGRVTVDGRSALRIESGRHDHLTRTDVDPSTYLPIQQIAPRLSGGRASSSTVDDFRYLLDTSANRARLTVRGVIPPGFHARG